MVQLGPQSSQSAGKSAAILAAAALLAVLATSFALLWNAATTNFWDDEVMGYFLCRAPFTEMFGLMAQNVHHDPPLFELIQQPWCRIAGVNVFLLRLPPFIYWMLALLGVFVATRRLAGNRAAWLAVLMTCAMPLHWIFPISMRWYSLTACLAVWNLAAFVGLRAVCNEDFPPASRRQLWSWNLIGYVITGVALWYANYIAPTYFLAHLIVALLWTKHAKPLGISLFLAWALIGLAYLPWLPTLLRQIPLSKDLSSPVLILSSLWTLWCGEFVQPFQWGATISYGVSGLLAAVFLIRHRGATRVPGVVFLTVAAGLAISGNLLPKRIMLLSPFVAIGLGLALASVLQEKRLLWKVALWVFSGAMTIGSAISAWNMISRDDWFAYRWLDPFDQVVSEITSKHDGALIMTNSISVMFYAGDEFGYLGAQQIRNFYGQPYRPKAFEYPFTDLVQKAFDESVNTASQIFVIHHNAAAPYSRAADAIAEQLGEYGFELAGEAGVLPVSELFARFHPHTAESAGPLDHYRIVVARFEQAQR